jgi:hypothetical protein
LCSIRSIDTRRKNAEGDGAEETKNNKEKITEVMGKSQAEQ